MIETERLILRPIRLDDAEDMYEYACLPEVTRRVTWDTHQSVEQTRLIIQEVFLAKETDYKWLPTFAVIEKRTGKMVGTCDTVQPISRYGNVEIGYTLNPQVWGQGYATEACRALCHYLFEHGVRRITIRHHVDNHGSRRVIEKCGFVKEGVLRKLMEFDDGFGDIVTYSLFKEELI